MKVSVSISGDKQIKRSLQKLARLAPQMMKQEVAASALAIEGDYKRKVPVDVGFLRAQIKSEFDDGGLTAAVGTNVMYGPYIEFGTRPHWPPRAPIEEWARRHGAENPKAFAYLICRKIAQRGTPARPALFPAYELEKPIFLLRCRQALRDACRQSA